MWSAIIHGLVGGAIATLLALLAERTQQKVSTDRDGWRRLRAGWYLRLAMFGSIAFSLAMLALLASGGSTHPDAGSENVHLLMTAIATTAAAAYLGWHAYGRRIMWHGDKLAVRDVFGRERAYARSDVRTITSREFSGTFVIDFKDGSRLGFSTYFHGAAELATWVSKGNGSND